MAQFRPFISADYLLTPPQTKSECSFATDPSDYASDSVSHLSNNFELKVLYGKFIIVSLKKTDIYVQTYNSK